MQETFVIIASILAIIGNVPYLRDVIRKRVSPHPYTWMIWSIVSCIIFFGQIAKGAGIGAIPTAAAEIFTIIIFFLSLKNGFKKIKKIDNVFLVICLLGIIPWILTKDPTISVIIAVSIDLVAFMPTIRKTWRDGHSETSALYSMNVLRHILMLFSLQAYNIATVLHSIAMIITNSLMTFLIFRKDLKNSMSKKT